MTRTLILIATALFLATPSLALAQGSNEYEPLPTPPSTDIAQDEDATYGKKIMTADAVSLGLVVGAAAVFNSESDDDKRLVVGIGLAGAGMISMHVAAPMVHLFQRNPKGALQSFGLRALPLLASGLVAQTGNDELMVGTYVGLGVAAMIIDAKYLAKKPPGDPYALRIGSVRAMPTVGVSSAGPTFGFVGQM